jgi:hypothetical protein
MMRLMALALVVALALPTLAVTARAASDGVDPDHRLEITFVPIPTTLEECLTVLRHGELTSWGPASSKFDYVRVYNGEFYFFASTKLRLRCTKLKPVLHDGTERD